MRWLFLGLVNLLPLNVLAQENLGTLEQNPASLKWKQIKTEKFRVIFPEGFENQAQRTASTLQAMYEPVSISLGKTPRAIPVVLQNQSTISNGFVTLLPRRSEFSTMPISDNSVLGAGNWLDLLSVHEFRHVVQFDKALTGATKAFYYLFGNQGLSLVTNTAVPNWFWEGDAVCTETVLTPSGRGRIPQFDLAFRTQLLTKGAYSYPKATGRSLKDYVENHYVLGYYLTTYFKNKYGANKWGEVLNRVYNFPFYPFSFSNAIKKTTGLRVEQLYQDAMADISAEWKKQVEQVADMPVEVLKTSQNKAFTNYQYPQFLPDGRIVALKSGMADIQTFVTFDKQQGEQKLYVPGIMNESGRLSTGGNLLVWAEHHFDPRWGQRDYSVIKMLDVGGKLVRQITRKTRLISPAFSPDGQRIVAVQVDDNNNCQLIVLDMVTGQTLKTLPNPSNQLYIQPSFTSDGTKIITIGNNRSGKNIELIDLESGQAQEVLERTFDNITHPIVVENKVLFNSPVSGIDNIYAIDLNSKAQYQVTSSKFGAYNPAISPDKKTLAFNDFTANGHRVVTMTFDPSLWRSLDRITTQPVRYFGKVLQQEAGANALRTVQDGNYPIKSYSKANIFNLYGWGAVLNSSDNNLYAGIKSQDLLSTTVLEAGYGFDATERTGKFYAQGSYQGWFPILDVAYTDGQRRTQGYIDRADPIDSLRTDQWRQQTLTTGFRIPLNLTHSKYSEVLSFSGGLSYLKVSDFDFTLRSYTETFNGSITSMYWQLAYQRLLKQATRDIFPRWGQSFYLLLRNTLSSTRTENKGNQLSAQLSLFFPGLGKHHSLRLRGGYQSDEETDYRFTRGIFYPRGYGYYIFGNLYTFNAEYRMPLLYPDWSLGRWLYIQRIKTTLFTDMAYGTGTQTVLVNKVPTKKAYSSQFGTFGIDLSADFNFMRFAQRFDIGVRAQYLTLENRWEVLPLVVNIGF
ncbi:MAG: hypothetical protein U0Y10_16610 [Spirosomataceae bacterium]